jgi:hypothetical protein
MVDFAASCPRRADAVVVSKQVTGGGRSGGQSACFAAGFDFRSIDSRRSQPEASASGAHADCAAVRTEAIALRHCGAPE